MTLIPGLAVLAYSGWRARLTGELPQWRSALGLTSIATTFLSWGILVMFGVFAVADVRADYSPNGIGPAVALISALLGFAFRGVPRILAVVAGILNLVAWLTSVVH